MLDPLRDFLPANIEDAPVVDGLPVPGYPRELLPYLPDMEEINAELKLGEYNAHEYHAFRESFGPRITAEAEVPGAPAGASRVAFINKHTLHSLHDSMLMVSDRRHLSALDELPQPVLSAFLDVGAAFARFVRDPESRTRHSLGRGKILMAFKYDQFPGDREGLMKYKRFHIPFNFLDDELLARIAQSRCRYGDIARLDARRRLLDPATFVTTQALYEYLRAHLRPSPTHQLLEPCFERDIRDGASLGLRVRVPEGWRALRQSWFPELLLALHGSFQRLYDSVYEALTGEPFAVRPWYRPTLLEPRQSTQRLSVIDGLTPSTIAQLVAFVQRLRPLSDRLMTRFRSSPNQARRHMVMGGPMYGLTLTEPTDQPAGDGPIEIIIRPTLFSAIGGAGLYSAGGASLVRVARERGVLTGRQIERRDHFQREFARFALASARLRPSEVEGRMHAAT